MEHLQRVVRSPAVLVIVALLVAVFAAQAVSSTVADELSLPGDLEEVGERPWSPLTVMVVHQNIAHLVVMVLMLAAFGSVLEEIAGSLHLLLVYVISGLAGSLAVLAAVVAVGPEGTLVGASAAVFGVSAAVLVMRWSSHIYGGRASQWLAVLVGINIVLLVSQPLGSVAHLAGLGAGVAYGRWLTAREGVARVS